jgi:transposase
MASQDPSSRKIGRKSASKEPSIEDWMATVDSLACQLQPILLEAYSGGPGRRPYPPLGMFKGLLLRTRINSLRQVCRRLRTDRHLLVLTGLPRAPTHQGFSVFISRIGPERFRLINNLLVGELRKHYPDFGKIISVDGTFVKAFAKNNLGKTSSTDRDARFGFKEKKNGKTVLDFGFRGTVPVDTKRELPLFVTTTAANGSESKLYRTILRQTKDLGIDFEVVTADKLFDSNLNNALTLGYKAIPVIGLNTRGSKRAKRTGKRLGDKILPIQRKTKEWRHYYRMRTASERVFSSLKKQLNFADLKTRGLARVACHFTLCIIAKLLTALSALRVGREDLTRSVLPWSY